MDDEPNEIEIVRSQETSELQNVLEGDKTVVEEEDDDSFESFGSGDRDELGKVEGGSLEREAVVEKVDETPEVQSGRISLSDF